MNISHVYDGVQQKEKLLKEICKKYAVTSSQIAYIGDDVNDLELLKKVGFSATPNDGIVDAKKIVDHVCEKNQHSSKQK